MILHFCPGVFIFANVIEDPAKWRSRRGGWEKKTGSHAIPASFFQPTNDLNIKGFLLDGNSTMTICTPINYIVPFL